MPRSDAWVLDDLGRIIKSARQARVFNKQWHRIFLERSTQARCSYRQSTAASLLTLPYRGRRQGLSGRFARVYPLSRVPEILWPRPNHASFCRMTFTHPLSVEKPRRMFRKSLVTKLDDGSYFLGAFEFSGMSFPVGYTPALV